MFCPKCEAEYVEGILKCSDCDVPLVYSLPENYEQNQSEPYPGESHSIDEDYTFIYSPINSQEVIFIKMILEREGIPYFIKNDNPYKQIMLASRENLIELYVPKRFETICIDLLNEELE